MKFVFEGLRRSRPGHNMLLKKIAALAGRNVAHISQPTQACMNCGSSEANYFASPSVPDFDIGVLPQNIRSVFAERCLGVCSECGYGQDYRRFSRDELKLYMQTLSDKDMAVSEEAFHTFPVPEEYITKFNAAYFSVRLDRWKRFLIDRRIKIDRALFLRPFFGAAPIFIQKTFNADCMGLEISGIARRTVNAKLPDFKFLPGNIHGELEGQFVKKEKFDLIVCCHTLVHCLDVRRELQKLYGMLTDNGAIIFMHETTVKPTNPFHLSFNSEAMFGELLNTNFAKVERLANCEAEPSRAISDFNDFGDVADLVALK